jgi:hypothetical protein
VTQIGRVCLRNPEKHLGIMDTCDLYFQGAVDLYIVITEKNKRKMVLYL